MSTDTSAVKPIPQLPGALPLVGHALEFQRDRLGLLARISGDCGELGMFRVGPKSILVINSAELVQQLLVDNSDKIHRGPFFDAFIPVMGEHSLVCINGPYHRKLRKMQMPAFGHRRMPKYAETMMESIVNVVGGLKDGQQVDMDEVMGQLTRLIIAKTLFGLDEGEKSNHFQHAVAQIEQHLTRMTTNVVPIPLWVPTRANRIARANILDVRKRADEIIREHRERYQGKDMGDLMSMILEIRNEDDGSPLSAEQLRDIVVTMYIAGQETTAVGLVWMCVQLAQNPEIQRKVQQEVDALEGRIPTFEDLPRLSYCLKVVKETLRLCPPAGAIGRETLEEVRLGDYLVPARQFILFSPWTIQRMHKYYPDPERFEPERFEPELEKARPRGSYLPFTTGVHTCLGNHFALMEMQLILAHMMQKVSIELRPGQDIRPMPYVTVKASSSDFIIRARSAQSSPRAVAS